MTLKASLNLDLPTRVFTEYDPYYYTVNNRPLGDLSKRDEYFADELDSRVVILDIDASTGKIEINALPVGWSIIRKGEGKFKVIHNLNLPVERLSITVSPITHNFPIISYISKQDRVSFDIKLMSPMDFSDIDTRFIAGVSVTKGLPPVVPLVIRTLKYPDVYANTTTGSYATVSLYDPNNTELSSHALDHEIAGTISTFTPGMIGVTTPNRWAYIGIPGEYQGSVDPMSLYSITEAGVLTQLNTGLTYQDLQYGPSWDFSGGWPANFTGFGPVTNNTKYTFPTGKMLRMSWLATDNWDLTTMPSETPIVIEVLLISDFAVIDTVMGTTATAYNYIYNTYPEFRVAFV